jgi:L-threonylcarbamoyladenylate synthase
MEILSSDLQDIDGKSANALKDGHLVVFPTETVYGLGADATNEKAISRIYAVKNRPLDHPLIVHISSIDILDKWAIKIPEYAVQIARKFWPGPLTLILKRNFLAKDFITGGQDNVGVRVPSNSIALQILKKFERLGGLGVAAPSANRYGAVSPTTATATMEEIGQLLDVKDLIIDGGNCQIGIESTIVNCTKANPEIIRPGAITLEMIQNTIDLKVFNHNHSIGFKAPGLAKSHYSPKATVVLNEIAQSGEGFIAIATFPTPKGVIRLAAPKNNIEFAHELYEALRNGDRLGLITIKVFLPEGNGLAESIRDRLTKSSFQKSS